MCVVHIHIHYNTDVRFLRIVFLSTRKYISIVSTGTSVYHNSLNVVYHLKFGLKVCLFKTILTNLR